ncbi:MAG TPA: hypothetical protein VFQ88_14195 [Nevskiaceae bacterium]|nr:hypothetical protein [Nevskiaceae bacterium]
MNRAVLLCAGLLLAPCIANAAIYKCTISGVLHFQDTQCASGHGTQMHVDAPAPTSTVGASIVRQAARMDEAEKCRSQRESIVGRLAHLHKESDLLEAAESAQDNYYTVEGDRANNNLAGAAYLASLSGEKQAAATRYASQRQQIQAQTESAQASLRALNASSCARLITP